MHRALIGSLKPQLYCTVFFHNSQAIHFGAYVSQLSHIFSFLPHLPEVSKPAFCRESGRPEEAKCENRRAIEENVFSWSAIKAQCDWGAAADVDEIYEQIAWKTSVKKSGVKAKSATP